MAEVIAVAYVVDASLALASEWRQTVVEYILPLLHRLGELHSNPHFRLGIVSYGPAETRPTPLLAKHYFAHPQVVIKEMREEPERVGVGLTSSGGSTGMAALEGLVAALELFDMLKESIETVTSHIVHVAAAPPDGSEHPVWNMTSVLDDVSWETLPLELKKRNINYSSILLKPVPRISELYALAAIGSAQLPWFPVRPPHALHLSGFSPVQPKGVKRAADGMTAGTRSIELKRPKVESEPSPSQPPVEGSQPLPNVSQPIPTHSPTQTQTAPQPPRVPLPQPPTREYLMQLNAHIQKKKLEIQELKQMGRAKEAENVERDTHKLLLLFRQAQLHLMKRASLQPPQSQPAAQTGSPVLRPGSTVAVGPTGVDGTQGSASMPPITSDVASLTQSNPQTDAPPIPPTAPAAEAPYSHPTLHQPPPPIAGPSTVQVPPHLPVQGVPNTILPVNGPPNDLLQTSPAMLNSQAARPPGFQVAPSRIWEGPVTWVEPTSGRPMQAHLAVSATDTHLRAFQWPPALTLEPSTEFRVQTGKLQDWLKIHVNDCAIILATPNASVNDPKQNEERSNLIWRSLFQSHRYATASFPDSSGTGPLKRLLLFPARPGQFAGAFFRGPVGMPELPPLYIGGIRVTGVPPNLADLLLTLNPQQSAEMESLNPAEKQAKLQEHAHSYTQKKMQEQQRLIMMQQAAQSRQQVPQQHSQDGTLGNATMALKPQPQPQQQQPSSSQQRQSIPPNNLNTIIPMNPFVNGVAPTMDNVLALGGSKPDPHTQLPNRMPSAGQNGLGIANTMGVQGMHRRVPSGGGGAHMNGMGGVNLSHEMMQSFMQRRQDRSGGTGGGMAGGMGAGLGL